MISKGGTPAKFGGIPLMQQLLHWGEHFHWIPIAWLFAAAVGMLAVRLLAAKLFARSLVRWAKARIRGDSKAKMPAELPQPLTSLYFLFVIAFLGITIWGLASTAWWMIVLGFLAWIVVHLPYTPYREVTEPEISYLRLPFSQRERREIKSLLRGGARTEGP
jgi:hypothetical protein